MSTGQLRAIAIGVLLLVLVWGASERWVRRPDTATPTLRLPALSAEDVETVTITHQADTLLLVRQPPGTWTVNRHAASPTSIDELLQAFRDSVPAELVAEHPSSFARMGVDSMGGRRIRVVGGGNTLAHVVVGEPGPGYTASYVRRIGDTHVYLLAGRLPTLAERGEDDWREHEIGAVAPDSVAAIDIRRGRARATLRKRGTGWVLANGAPADSGAVARLLEHFRSIKAAGFATDRQADSLRFTRPERSVSVHGTGSGPLLALVFDSTASGYWVRKAGGGTVYRLDAWQVEQLTPSMEGLVAASAARRKPS